MGIWRKSESTPAAAAALFALRGQDRRSLAATLERLALIAPRLPDRERQDLAAQWNREAAAEGGGPAGAGTGGGAAPGAAGADRPGARDGEIRVAFPAKDNGQLVTRARLAADLVSTVRPGPVTRKGGVYLSCGAGGRVALLFPGGNGVPAAEAAAPATSLRTLGTLDRFGVTPVAAAGAGLGEITGLVWAGSLTATEASRLVTQHGELRRAAGMTRTALARVPACYMTTTKLAAACGLFVAAYESPHSHVLGGPAAAIRDLTRQAGTLGLTAEVLAADHALHTRPGPQAAGDGAAAEPAPPSLVDGADLYGTVCFQTGRFRRVAIVSGRPPRSCRAIVRGHDDTPWFEQFPEAARPHELMLGSPGLNDAALQVAQACVPGRLLRPGGCDSLTVTGAQVRGAVELRVFLISGPAGRPVPGQEAVEPAEYVWDIHGYDSSGQLVIAWIGLRMRDAGSRRSRHGQAQRRPQAQGAQLAAVPSPPRPRRPARCVLA